VDAPFLRIPTVTLAFVLCTVSAATAQQPDSAEIFVFNDVLSPREPGFVILSQGVTYRMDVVPATAIIEVRLRRLPGAMPLAFRPLRDPAAVEGGASYLIVPSETGEYRLESVGATEAVRVRIARDPRESRILAGQGRPPRSVAAFGVRMVGIPTRFETTRYTASGADSTVTGTAIGGEVCLGVRPGRFRESPQLGGCLFTIGYYSHSGGAKLLLAGTNPHYVISAPDSRFEAAIAVHFAFGKAAEPFRRDAAYVMLGAGPNLSWRASGRLTLSVAPTVTLVRRGGYTQAPSTFDPQQRSVPGAATVAPRLVAGAHFGL
jgi:hypothetical protein